MTPHKQLCKHDPANGSWGDCFRTAIASVLDLHPSLVPHVFDDPPADGDGSAGHDAMEAWLNDRGLTLLKVIADGSAQLPDLMRMVGGLNPQVAYMIGGQTRPGIGHFIVCHGDHIVSDPSPAEPGLTAPMDDGYWWVYFIGAAQ